MAIQLSTVQLSVAPSAAPSAAPIADSMRAADSLRESDDQQAPFHFWSTAPKVGPIATLMRAADSLRESDDQQAALHVCVTGLVDHPDQLRHAAEIIVTDVRGAEGVSRFVQRQYVPILAAIPLPRASHLSGAQAAEVSESELHKKTIAKISDVEGRRIKAKALENLATNFSDPDIAPTAPFSKLTFRQIDIITRFLTPTTGKFHKDLRALGCNKTLLRYVKESIKFSTSIVSWRQVSQRFSGQRGFEKFFDSLRIVHSNGKEQIGYLTLDDVTRMFLENSGLEVVDFRGFSNLPRTLVQTLSTACRQLRAVDFSETPIDWDAISDFLHARPKLQSLLLMHCPNLPLLAITKVADSIPGIRTFGFAGNREVTDGYVRYFLKRCPIVEKLNLSDCPLLSDQTLFAISKCRRVRELIVAGNNNFTDAGVSAVAIGCTRLTRFDISDCPRLTNNCLQVVGSNAKNLINLAIARNQNFGDEGIRAIADGCQNIKFLDMKGCRASREVINMFQDLLYRRNAPDIEAMLAEDSDEESNERWRTQNIHDLLDKSFYARDIPESAVPALPPQAPAHPAAAAPPPARVAAQAAQGNPNSETCCVIL